MWAADKRSAIVTGRAGCIKPCRCCTAASVRWRAGVKLCAEMEIVMADLPREYCSEMRRLLGDEYDRYLESLSEASCTAYRVNTRKVRGNLFSDDRVPWCENGYYYDAEKFSPAKHPYYFAGLYYIQEPSAMIPAAVLPIEPGDVVLDLCAAPGGKATELGSRLDGTGFLVANDVSVSRTKALAKNLQMAGIANVLVTAETPEKLAGAYPETFDKILVDAPCSGEGMFRREPRMVRDWVERGPESYVPLQREILAQAYRMLKPGGKMVYSTCTFSVEEDERTVDWLLKRHSDMHICKLQHRDGFAPGRTDMVEDPVSPMEECVRIFPHRAKGEGHFAVLLEKTPRDGGGTPGSSGISACKVKGDTILQRDVRLKKNLGAAREDVTQFLSHVLLPDGVFTYEKDTLMWHSHSELPHRGIRTVCSGLPVCRWNHKVKPSPQLALVLEPGDYDNVLSFQLGDERVIRYLKGETLQTEERREGDVLVCVDGYGLGWAYGNGRGMLKNKYYPGWRLQ